jgi:hypothetical protein
LDKIRVERLVTEQHLVWYDQDPRLAGPHTLDAKHHLDAVGSGRVFFERCNPHNSPKLHDRPPVWAETPARS